MRGLKHRPGGVRLPPGATKILSYWGIEQEVAQKASITPSSSILDSECPCPGHMHTASETKLTSLFIFFVRSKVKTGRSISQSTWQMGLIEGLGSSFYMMHVSPVCRHAPPFDIKFHDDQHADLLEILLRVALSAGARVQFGVTVQSVEPAREDPSQNSTINSSIAGRSSSTLRPTVRLRTGEILHADVIIGADGQRSIVRRLVTDEDEEPEAMSIGLSMCTGCVPMTEVRKYPPLKQLADVGWSAWVGDGRAVLGTLKFIHFHNTRNDPRV
jgi:hypothetical protein